MSEWYEELGAEVKNLATMRCMAQRETLLGDKTCPPSCMICRNDMFKKVAEAIESCSKTAITLPDTWDSIYEDMALSVEDYASKWDLAIVHDNAEEDKKLHLQGRMKAMADKER